MRGLAESWPGSDRVDGVGGVIARMERNRSPDVTDPGLRAERDCCSSIDKHWIHSLDFCREL